MGALAKNQCGYDNTGGYEAIGPMQIVAQETQQGDDGGE
mgnify:FL=1